MSRISTRRAARSKDEILPPDEQEELSDVPMTPREGWTSVVALAVMMMTIGIAIDDARWAGPIGTSSISQTGFLPIVGILSVLLGAYLAKKTVGRYTGHLIGASIGAAVLLNAIARVRLDRARVGTAHARPQSVRVDLG